MGKDIPLGKLAGIRVGMNITVLLAAAFYAFILATRILPDYQTDLSTTDYWVAAVVGALLLFLSLLVHELGHALVARDEGIGVISMELTIYGGVTRMESSPQTPGAEFRVSVVGPLASVCCGIVFLVGAVLFPTGGAFSLAGSLFAWVGAVNVFLAGINMIPATPLDGGKVLASIIWRLTGNQTKALTWTAVVGVVLGMAAFTWGIREMRNHGSREDWALTAVIIGGFVAFGAIQQLRSAPVYRALDGLTVASTMVVGPPTAPSWATVGEFLRTSSPRPEHQAYPVVGPDGQVSGLLTAAAIRSVPPERWDDLAVTALAYPIDRLTIVHPEEELLGALQRLESGDVRTALVADTSGRIIGTLDRSALDQAMALRKEPVASTGV